MQTVDAWELLTVVKKTPITSHIAVVAVSAKHTAEIESRAHALGAAACLAKQSAFGKLRQVIEEASGRRSASRATK